MRMESERADAAHLRELCDHYGVTPPTPETRVFSADLGGVCRVQVRRVRVQVVVP